MRTIILSALSPLRRHALTPLRRFILPTLAFGLICVGTVQAQVGSSISADGTTPNVNAMLDVQSPTTGDGKGILIPRLTGNQRTNANASLAGGLLDNAGNLRGGAAQGLIVYQTDGAQGLYFNTNLTATPAWVYLGSSTTNYLPLTGGTMSGALNMGAQIITNVAQIDFNGNSVSVGRGANGSAEGAAVGYAANGSSYGVAMGRGANGYAAGAAMGYAATGTTYGAAMGYAANGANYGVAMGREANGANYSVAIGVRANAGGGTRRIAIGNNVTNTVDYTARIRGDLYLDGGTNIWTNSTFGSSVWGIKAFTIDHPLDPENKVLRHYCLEGPQVWNVYAGNVPLVHGQAVVELPDYYSVLNLVGSEIYSLTVVGESANQFPVVKVATKVADNRFVIAGTVDVEVSWTIKVLRNDPGCLEDLRRRPVEQLKSELQ